MIRERPEDGTSWPHTACRIGGNLASWCGWMCIKFTGRGRWGTSCLRDRLRPSASRSVAVLIRQAERPSSNWGSRDQGAAAQGLARANGAFHETACITARVREHSCSRRISLKRGSAVTWFSPEIKYSVTSHGPVTPVLVQETRFALVRIRDLHMTPSCVSCQTRMLHQARCCEYE